MLESIEISGLVYINHIHINLSSGLNVLTGESGAGKSLIIAALKILAGEKIRVEQINPKSKRFNVTGYFNVAKNHVLIPILEEIGVDLDREERSDEDNISGKSNYQVIIKREQKHSGRMRSWINDSAVTSSTLKKVSSYLLEIFAQHTTLKLKDPSYQLEIIDFIADKRKLREQYLSVYRKIQGELEQLKAFSSEMNSLNQDKDYLLFRFDELKALNLDPEYFASLEDQYQEASRLKEDIMVLSQVRNLLEGGADGETVAGNLLQCVRILEKKPLSIEKHESEEKDVLSKSDWLADTAAAIEDFCYGINQQLYDIEQKIYQYEQDYEEYGILKNILKRYSTFDMEQVLKERTIIKQKLDKIEAAPGVLEAGIETLNSQLQTLQEIAQKLSKQRKKQSKIIAAKLEAELELLGMKNFRVRVATTENRSHSKTFPNLASFDISDKHKTLWKEIEKILQTLSSQGAEGAQIELAQGAKGQFLNLKQAGSGGELSRIFLAIGKVMICEKEDKLIIFDEADSGISGKIADKVGAQIKSISKQTQVLIITHLAQVASYAESHFLVEKQEKKEHLDLRVDCLDEDKQIMEIASLLSSQNITPQSIENARHMVLQNRH